jgi:hypothetical protein
VLFLDKICKKNVKMSWGAFLKVNQARLYVAHGNGTLSQATQTKIVFLSSKQNAWI